MKVQIIGLPCSGKTTIINNYLSKRSNINYIDIRDYEGSRKNTLYKKDIKKSSSPLIAESACGVSIHDTEVVRLDIPRKLLYERLMLRDKSLDEDYLSLLETQMVPAKYTVRTQDALTVLLDNIFYGK